MFNIILNEFQDKKIAKVAYYTLSSLFRRRQPSKRFIMNDGCKLEQVYKLSNIETFFGYYDKSPLSLDKRYILLHVTKYRTWLNPSRSSHICLVLFDIHANKVVKNWNILAYNWQQGCKPQWLSEHEFIFNNYDSNNHQYYSSIVDVRDLSEKRICFPHYDSCFKYSLSLNFYRLSKFRPDYGYRNIKNLQLDNVKDGIFVTDLSTKNTELLISIQQLIAYNHKSSMDFSVHKVNHIMISPSFNKFMFMHRWIHGKRKEDRLYVYDFITRKLSLVADTGMVSHCYWLNDNTIIGYMKGNDCQNGYYRIDLQFNRFERLPEVIQNFGDGHPSILGTKMIFDTYPDKNRLKHLYLFDLATIQVKELASFYEPLCYENQCRCDLHPRFISNNLVSIDSTHNGSRQLYLLNI